MTTTRTGVIPSQFLRWAKVWALSKVIEIDTEANRVRALGDVAQIHGMLARYIEGAFDDMQGTGIKAAARFLDGLAMLVHLYVTGEELDITERRDAEGWREWTFPLIGVEGTKHPYRCFVRREWQASRMITIRTSPATSRSASARELEGAEDVATVVLTFDEVRTLHAVLGRVLADLGEVEPA